MKYVTLAPEKTNVEMVKETGQIPEELCRLYGVESEFVSCSLDLNGAYVDNIRNMKLVHIKMYFKNYSISGLIYILKHCKEIDWLALHHAGRRSLIWTKIFKWLNPKGRVYLKLDLDFNSCDMYDSNLYERKLFDFNTRAADIVSVESQAVWKRIQPYTKKKIKIVRNGFHEPTEKLNVERPRENVFLTVGRLGTKQKATEVLLEAFARSANSHEWNLKLVGTIEKDFENYINDYYERYPNLKNRVFFTGEIENRNLLYEEYCKAKVFVLPSRWESFGIVTVEAIYSGCFAIVTEQIPPAFELTCNQKFGKIISADDIGALACALEESSKIEFTPSFSAEISHYAVNTFKYDKICKELYGYLMEVSAS